MRFIYAIFSFLLFLLLLGFGLRNQELVIIRYYLGIAWQAPLSLTLLIVMTIGVVLTLIGLTPLMIKQRKEILALKRELSNLKSNV